MSTSSNDAQYTAGRNSYVGYVGTGIWLGTALGALTIIPTMILGVFTLPITSVFTLWKVIDQCTITGVEFWQCTFFILPWSDLYALTALGANTGFPSY